MQNAMRALAGVLPNAEHRTLAGQSHMLKPKAVAPVLGEFFGEEEAAKSSTSMRQPTQAVA